MEKYIQKIKKLLSLVNSDNEHEAKLAMVKAQRLMAEHKLEMADLGIEDDNEKVIKKETKWYFTTYRNAYRNTLINLIVNLYCCENYLSTPRNSKKTI